MSANYKLAKEAFVSGMTGSSITHINLISLAALCSVTLYASVRTRLSPLKPIAFFSSWLLLVVPLLLSMTLFANSPLILSFALLVPAGALILFLPYRESGSPLPSTQHSSSSEHMSISNHIPPLPALTTYRAHMMLMTILAILAVDFSVFPRSLAKCETFGVSLMDMGVGSFVFSQGVVSAIPLIKNPSYLVTPLWPKVYNVTYKSLPVIVLGLVRVLLVKGTEYPEHESEYGTHWNFFLTLAFVPILQVLLHPVLLRMPFSLAGIILGLGQQFALNHLKLQSYVLEAPRTSIISANKEGIISLTGYLAIHLLGLSTGTIILSPSPSFFRRRQQALAREKTTKRRNSDASLYSQAQTDEKDKDLNLSSPRRTGKTATELFSYTFVWWTLLGLTRAAKFGGKWSEEGGISRRLVNFPYIIWVAAYNTTFILLYLVVLDLYFFPGQTPAKNKTAAAVPAPPHSSPTAPSHSRKQDGNPPALLEAISTHGLMLFLIANVMTGAINLFLPTMYASHFVAMAILCGYSLVVCAIAWIWSSLEKEKKVAKK